jgi:hypothetical protein
MLPPLCGHDTGCHPHKHNLQSFSKDIIEHLGLGWKRKERLKRHTSYSFSKNSHAEHEM